MTYIPILTDFSLKDHHVVTPVVVGRPKMKLRVNVAMPPVVMKIVKMILLIMMILLRFRLNKEINRELNDDHNHNISSLVVSRGLLHDFITSPINCLQH